jgi:hypothetical protein
LPTLIMLVLLPVPMLDAINAPVAKLYVAKSMPAGAAAPPAHVVT